MLPLKVRMMKHGFVQKVCALACGKAEVSRSCQIEDIRKIYGQVGLLPRSGTFVEIGGFDGHSFSNTSFLADQGWNGVYFEPIRGYAKLAKARHLLNRVEVYEVAISEVHGQVRAYQMGVLTTLKDQTYQEYAKVDWAKNLTKSSRRVEVCSMPLLDSFSLANVPKSFDLLVVDCEGGEEDVFKMLFNSDYKPKVIIAELVDGHPDFGINSEEGRSHARTRKNIQKNAYREIYIDAINTVFQIR